MCGQQKVWTGPMVERVWMGEAAERVGLRDAGRTRNERVGKRSGGCLRRVEGTWRSGGSRDWKKAVKRRSIVQALRMSDCDLCK